MRVKRPRANRNRGETTWGGGGGVGGERDSGRNDPVPSGTGDTNQSRLS